MSTYLKRTKVLAAAALLALAMVFGLASIPQAYGNQVTGGSIQSDNGFQLYSNANNSLAPGTYELSVTPSSTMVKFMYGDEYATELVVHEDGTSTLIVNTTSTPDGNGAPYFDKMWMSFDPEANPPAGGSGAVDGVPIIKAADEGKKYATSPYIQGSSFASLQYSYDPNPGDSVDEYIVGYRYELPFQAGDLASLAAWINGDKELRIRQAYTSYWKSSNPTSTTTHSGDWATTNWKLAANSATISSMNLTVFNTATMFNFATTGAAITKDASGQYLVFSFAASKGKPSNYKKVYVGDIWSYNALGDKESAVIEGVVDAQNVTTYTIPVVADLSNGSFTIPLVFLTNGNTETVTARRADIDLSSATITSGNYQGTIDVAVASTLSEFADTGVLIIDGYPAMTNIASSSTSLIEQISLTPASNDFAFDQITVDTYNSTDPGNDNTYSTDAVDSNPEVLIVDGKAVISLENSYKQFHQIADGDKVTTASVKFHVRDDSGYAEAGTWVSRNITIDCDNKVVTIAGNPLTKTSIATAEVALVNPKESFTYDGKEKKPAISVKLGNTVLDPSNYNVAYSGNTNAGTATITVTGKNGYSDSAKANFTINPITIAVPTAKTGLVYNGKAQTGVAAGANYTITGNSATDAGSYTATLTAKPNYQFTGAKATASVKWSIAKATIQVPAPKTGLVYNGKAQAGVAAGANYTVKNGSATNAGNYTATLTAKQNYQFAGAKTTASVKWSIAKAANLLKLAKATRTVKASKVAKAKKVVLGAKVSKKGQGAVTYVKKSVNKKKFKKNFTVNKKTGKITVKKGTPKGTYKVTVKATAAGNANYNKSAAKTAVVTIKVK